MTLRAPVAAVAAAGLLLAADARAESAAPRGPQARLVYERGDGASECPSEAEVRAGVAARLGWDPFLADAPDSIRVTIAREGGVLVARIERSGPDGTSLGSRSVASADADCRELASATTFALAIAIDPGSFTRAPVGPAAAPPAPAPAPAPRSRAAPPPPPAPPTTPPPTAAEEAPDPRVEGLMGAALHVAFLAAPSPAPGASIHGGLRLGWMSARVEGRFDLPVEGASEGPPGVVESQVLAGALVPCGHVDPLALCGVVAVGALRGAGHGVSDPRTDVTPALSFGPRVEIEARASRVLGLFAHVDALATLPRTTLQLDGRDARELPLVSVLVAVGGRLHLGGGNRPRR